MREYLKRIDLVRQDNELTAKLLGKEKTQGLDTQDEDIER